MMADVPVIFLSVYGQHKLITRAFEMGAAAYVVKPFSPTELLARTRAALRRREVGWEREPRVEGSAGAGRSRPVEVAELLFEFHELPHRPAVGVLGFVHRARQVVANHTAPSSNGSLTSRTQDAGAFFGSNSSPFSSGK